MGPWGERASEGSNTCIYRTQVSQPASGHASTAARQLVFCSAGRRTSGEFFNGAGTKDNRLSSLCREVEGREGDFRMKWSNKRGRCHIKS